MSTHLLESFHVGIIELSFSHITYVLFQQSFHLVLICLFIDKFVSDDMVNIITNLFSFMHLVFCAVFLLK